MLKDFRLDGLRALVTGASQGNGLGMAGGLAEAGADLVLVARTESELQKAADSIQRDNQRVDIAPFDLQEVDAIPEWYRSVIKRVGPVDILVNNAGMTKRGPSEEIEQSDWDQVLNLNLTAMFKLCQAFAKERFPERKRGKIINIASLMTTAVRKMNAPYSASKGGVGQLTKALAIDWADKNMWVNAIAPGYMDTPLHETLVNDPEFDAWVKKRCPLGRWGKPEDLAMPAVFLASSASDFVTGQVIYVDGGWLAAF